MVDYRCYFLNSQDRIKAAVDIQADRLEEAIERGLAALSERTDHQSIELWRGAVRLYASREPIPRHQCHVYEGAQANTLQAMAVVIDQKLKANVRCLYLNSPPMIAGLRFNLTTLGVDLEHETGRGALILSSAQDHLVDGRFEPGRMLEMLDEAVDQALADGFAGLWASGDMTWELGGPCSVDDLLNYEWGLEGIFRRRPELSGVCQYHCDTLPPELVEHGVAVHRSAFVNETLSRLNPHYVPASSAEGLGAEVAAMVEELCAAAREPRPLS